MAGIACFLFGAVLSTKNGLEDGKGVRVGVRQVEGCAAELRTACGLGAPQNALLGRASKRQHLSVRTVPGTSASFSHNLGTGQNSQSCSPCPATDGGTFKLASNETRLQDADGVGRRFFSLTFCCWPVEEIQFHVPASVHFTRLTTVPNSPGTLFLARGRLLLSFLTYYIHIFSSLDF